MTRLKILVPIDFSIYSRYSLDFAISLLKNESDSILALHVTYGPIIDEMIDPGNINMYQTELDRILLEQNKRNMETYTKSYGDKVKSVIEMGNINEVINDYVEKKDFNLIIIGSRGASESKDFLIGSTTEKIIRHAKCPVFSINEPLVKDEINNMVFASDFKEVSPSLIKQLKKLQQTFNCKIHFVKINTPTHFEQDLKVNKRVQKFFEKYAFDNYTFCIYNDFNEWEGIQNFADKIDAQLIALGTHGHRGLVHLFSKNIAESVVHHSWRLVWTYKMTDEYKLKEKSKLSQKLATDF